MRVCRMGAPRVTAFSAFLCVCALRVSLSLLCFCVLVLCVRAFLFSACLCVGALCVSLLCAVGQLARD